MSQEKTNEKEWGTWIDNLIIEDTFQKENIPFYQYAEFQDNSNNYMIIFEYVNEGSLRQFLKTNFQKLDWNIKLNLALQIANSLMFLHTNDISHGRLNSENILVYNGIIKLNVFGLTKFNSNSLSFFTNTLGIILWEISSGNPPFVMESLSNEKGKWLYLEHLISNKYKELYTDCWNHNGNSRPDISQVVKNLSEIIIFDLSVEFETPYNVTDEIKLKKFKMQNEEPKIKSGPPFLMS
ncbi:hypothetical protein Glove_275g36 [Diversispora epigaea]|uniref:Protein kinase domain-containing protein n=1 Tax=Diversispora epigaea TaxID=1348612 RepID=A0A397IAG0_9GLOM|nr:hypothetical protein Glove_275g36 [Diversispora epigaea]